ncbi:MAG: hypothetical protein PVH64_07540 [Bacillota bacterium]|jgi:hypothetical protein
MKKLCTICLTMGLFFLLALGVQAATSLTGTWSCNEGGTYYITQRGDSVYWYGEQNPTSPSWANIGVGKIIGNYIFIEATDIPKGKATAQSNLILYRSGDNYFYRMAGSWGGSTWSR